MIFLKRFYCSVLVFASVSDTACLAHSGLILIDVWNILSMASDNSSVFLTVRVAITSLTFFRGSLDQPAGYQNPQS